MDQQRQKYNLLGGSNRWK